MRIWLGTFAAVGLLGVSMAACSSTPAPPYPDVASFCAARAQAECQVSPTCAIDLPTCKQVRTQACTADANTALSSGTRHYNTTNAVTCINKLQQVFTSQTTRIPYATLYGIGSITDTCERVFQGSAGNNQACQTNYDCTNNEICAPVAPGSSSSVCAAPVTVATGGFCANPGSVCATGSFCATTPGGAAQCQAGAASGQACSTANSCAAGLHCVGSTCVAEVGPGNVCTVDSDCSSSAPYCDPYAGNICTVGLTFATGASDCNAFKMTSLPPPVDAGTGDGG